MSTSGRIIARCHEARRRPAVNGQFNVGPLLRPENRAAIEEIGIAAEVSLSK
ncbi:MAG: hypothetical protein NZ899_11470 [Thermoguttaceae bacterium]|nr:hypothetical protein [Thermoguttaceae bacterium]